jgi:phosphogluconate dehydratase
MSPPSVSDRSYPPLHPSIARVTERIAQRSAATRADYLARMRAARPKASARAKLSCGNLAHGFAASGTDKANLKAAAGVNVGIVTAYNDMLSAHQPFLHYPELIKMAARNLGASAQVAGGVPAMCDGVTQGRVGMELSLFSRDVIAMSTAVALSHEMFDAAIMLGVCDKIVPGMLIGALSFGYLPTIFVPAGPMPSGLPNSEKARVRQAYAAGTASRAELLDAESASYHAPGTCTFYGTANSNQLLLECMGLHMPSTSFVAPNTPLRDALTVAAAERACRISALSDDYTPMAETVDEKCIVNALVGLCASGGSTNHTIHWIAIARAAGIMIDWTDLDEISQATPLLARIYPNGQADVNHFHQAGGIAFLLRELLQAGLLHPDIRCVHGGDLFAQAQSAELQGTTLRWRDPPATSLDSNVLRPASEPFQRDGGLRLVQGNLGRAVVKTSAVAAAHQKIKAPARVFESQDALLQSFQAGQLDGLDFVAVIRGQGPAANGMPELHKLTPTLSLLQDRGQHVALLTDGRMSGASGKVLAAIHVTPEALHAGALAKLQDGDVIEIDAEAGVLQVMLDSSTLADRPLHAVDAAANRFGLGRELFQGFRNSVSSAETGACSVTL